VIIEWTYKEEPKKRSHSAEIWRVNETKVTKVFAKDKEVASVVVDPKKKPPISQLMIMCSKSSTASKFDELKRKRTNFFTAKTQRRKGNANEFTLRLCALRFLYFNYSQSQ